MQETEASALLNHLSPSPHELLEVDLRGEHSVVIPISLLIDGRAANSLLPQLVRAQQEREHEVPCGGGGCRSRLYLNVEPAAFRRILTWLDCGVCPSEKETTARDGEEAWLTLVSLVRRLKLRNLLPEDCARNDIYIPNADGPYQVTSKQAPIGSHALPRHRVQSVVRCCRSNSYALPTAGDETLFPSSKESVFPDSQSDQRHPSLRGAFRDLARRHTPLRFSGMDLSFRDFSDTNDLRGADLQGCNLTGTIFCGCDLTGANLCRANLFCADLRGACLDQADLSNAILTGVRLEKELTCYGCNKKGNDVLAFARASQWRQRNDAFFHYGLYKADCHYRPGDR